MPHNPHIVDDLEANTKPIDPALVRKHYRKLMHLVRKARDVAAAGQRLVPFEKLLSGLTPAECKLVAEREAVLYQIRDECLARHRVKESRP